MGSDSIIGEILPIAKDVLDEIQNYDVLVGFSGFGNIGYLSLTHFVEILDMETIAFWGNSSWYHNGNIESIITVYRHDPSETIIVLPRLPIHVSTVSQQFWDKLGKEVLSWNCKRYIIVGGVREETREPGNTDWAAYVPTPKWNEEYSDTRTFEDHLAMIGPLSSFLVLGTSMQKSVLGLLAYCNLEEDPEASLIAVNKIKDICGFEISDQDHLERFDFSFIPGGSMDIPSPDFDETEDLDDSEDDDDMPGYDLSDLV